MSCSSVQRPVFQEKEDAILIKESSRQRTHSQRPLLWGSSTVAVLSIKGELFMQRTHLPPQNNECPLCSDLIPIRGLQRWRHNASDKHLPTARRSQLIAILSWRDQYLFDSRAKMEAPKSWPPGNPSRPVLEKSRFYCQVGIHRAGCVALWETHPNQSKIVTGQDEFLLPTSCISHT